VKGTVGEEELEKTITAVSYAVMMFDRIFATTLTTKASFKIKYN